MRQCEALETFKAQQEGDLGFKKGDILTVLFARLVPCVIEIVVT